MMLGQPSLGCGSETDHEYLLGQERVEGMSVRETVAKGCAPGDRVFATPRVRSKHSVGAKHSDGA
jgi:hypothetical protein